MLRGRGVYADISSAISERPAGLLIGLRGLTQIAAHTHRLARQEVSAREHTHVLRRRHAAVGKFTHPVSCADQRGRATAPRKRRGNSEARVATSASFRLLL